MSSGFRGSGLLACLVGALAHGQAPGEHHLYVGAALGQSKLNRNHVFDNPVQSSDDESGIYSIQLGYRFNQYFALEGGYSDLGSYELVLEGLCLTSLPPVCGGPVPTRTEVDGFFANAIGTWPVTPHFELSGSAGMIYREVEFNVISGGDTRYSAQGAVWKFGIGAGFPINDRVEIGLDLTYYMELGLDLVTPVPGVPHIVDSGDATALTLGARWYF
jgi:OmpA-OmpF porin, OOP family